LHHPHARGGQTITRRSGATMLCPPYWPAEVMLRTLAAPPRRKQNQQPAPAAAI
jgi:hypothetical protein